MTDFKPGDIKSTLCYRDGRVSASFQYRDVPVSNSHCVVKNILVGVCDTCQDVIIIPAQSTPVIKQAIENQEDL